MLRDQEIEVEFVKDSCVQHKGGKKVVTREVLLVSRGKGLPHVYLSLTLLGAPVKPGDKFVVSLRKA